jgi:integrase
VSEGLVDERVIHELVLPRRRGGGPWYRCPESRFLTREELRRLLAAIPDQWRPLFDLLALTGLRISEAIGLRWCDLDLDRQVSRLHVRQAIVRGVLMGNGFGRSICVATCCVRRWRAPGSHHSDCMRHATRAPPC